MDAVHSSVHTPEGSQGEAALETGQEKTGAASVNFWPLWLWRGWDQGQDLAMPG